jgi:hypothetical protein
MLQLLRISCFKTGYYILALLTLIILTIFLFIPIVLPLFIWWGFAILTAKCFNPSLGRPLSPQSAIFARDDLYVQPGETVTLALGYDGQINKSQVEKRYKEILENQFPELKQYLSRWMGFFFWADDMSFCLDDHISTCDEEIRTIEELEERRNEMANKPFKEGKALWELVLFVNCKFDEETIKANGGMKAACILRAHHCLVDGYSLLKVINCMTDDKDLFDNLPKPNLPKRSLIRWALFVLRFCVRASLDVLVAAFEANRYQNDWNIPQVNLQGKGFRAATVVPLSKVKNVGAKHHVRTSAVIYAALTGGIRKSMELKGSKIPKGFTIMCPLPLPSHPDHLTNYM